MHKSGDMCMWVHAHSRRRYALNDCFTAVEKQRRRNQRNINPFNPELNPIGYLLALLTHHFLHVSRIMVKSLPLRLLMSYIYGSHILDVSRSHITTHHSRYDSSGRVISSSQRSLPDNTRHSQQTNIHAPGGI